MTSDLIIYLHITVQVKTDIEHFQLNCSLFLMSHCSLLTPLFWLFTAHFSTSFITDSHFSLFIFQYLLLLTSNSFLNHHCLFFIPHFIFSFFLNLLGSFLQFTFYSSLILLSSHSSLLTFHCSPLTPALHSSLLILHFTLLTAHLSLFAA